MTDFVPHDDDIVDFNHDTWHEDICKDLLIMVMWVDKS